MQFWIDVHVPPNAPPGDYTAACELIPAPPPGSKPQQQQSKSKGKPNGPPAVASVPLRLTVYNFALPRERHLQMLTQVQWDSLVQQYPNEFGTVTPRLIERGNPKYASTVRVLDAMVKLTQHHRLGLYVPKLQPTGEVAGETATPPEIDWTRFRRARSGRGSRATASTTASASPTGRSPRSTGSTPTTSTRACSTGARRSATSTRTTGSTGPASSLTKVAPGRASAQEAMELSIEAAELLSAHNRLRVTVPLEDDQVQLAPANAPGAAGPPNPQSGIDPAATGRLLTSSPGLVSSSPVQQWPEDVTEPEHWLRTDLPGLVPYVGAGGDENDVRLWAYLAFLRNAGWRSGARRCRRSPTPPPRPTRTS